MSYRPEEGRIECRQLSRLLKEIDAEIQCGIFKAKEQDLERIIESTKRYYEEIGSEYDELWYSPYAYVQYDKLYSLLQRKVSRLLSPSALILDAGCGTCEWATVMMKQGALIVGFDQSLKMLQIGREKSVSQGLGQNLNLIRGDLNHLPFKEETFDGITILFVLSHLPEYKMGNFLSELVRVTRKEGWSLVVDSRLREPHERQELQVRTLKSGKEYIIYKRYFTAVELRTLLEKQLSRFSLASELDRYIICMSSP